jgi:hypothetical protein
MTKISHNHVKIKLLWIILFYIISNNNAISQVYNFLIGIDYRNGIISNPNLRNSDLIKHNTNSLNLKIIWQTNGETDWHKYFNYPAIGINFLYINLGNKETLGNIAGIKPNIEFKIFRTKIFSSSVNFGLGAVYANKSFDNYNNYKNTLLGSNINAILSSDLIFNMNIYKNIIIDYGVSITHCSNGNTYKPNYGLNMFSINGGIKYNFEKNLPFPIFRKTINNEEKYFIVLSTNYSVSQSFPPKSKRFGIINLMTDINRKINEEFSFGFGFDFEKEFARNDILPNKLHYENYLLGMKTLFSIYFGNLDISIALGHDLNGFNPQWYDWIILRYTIIKHIKLNLSYKSYLLTGDHLSYGISYYF